MKSAPAEVSLLVCLLALCMVAVPLGARAGEREISITDYTSRGFAPDVVNYELTSRDVDVKKFRITAADGTPVALQVIKPEKSGNPTLSFIAEVAPGKTATYKLTDDGKAPAAASMLSVKREGDAIVLANGLFAVKLPGEVDKTYKTPVAASTLASPVLAFRSGAAGAWLGEGKVLSSRLVKAWRVRLIASGPVFATLRYEIDWAEGGYYRADLRVADRVPIVDIREEYDLGKMVTQSDPWELDLTKGWSPDMAEVAKTWGNGGVDPGRVVPLAQAKLAPIQPSGAYGDMSSQLGLFVDAQAKADPNTHPLVGVVPLNQGYWRRVETLDLLSPDGGNKQIVLRLPMTRTPPLWVETSPFCVITHENELPYTYARRAWALQLARPALLAKPNDNESLGPCYSARVFYGVVGLDRYKDYITQWNSGNPRYPRGLMRVEELPKFKEALETPLGVPVKKAYSVLSGDAETAKRNAASRDLDNYIRYLAVTPTPSHHRMYECTRVASMAEDALAWEQLPQEQRKSLLARLAVFAYLMTEADLMGNGNGAHVGNPNMSIARQSWLPNLIALLPDHPMYEKWRDHITTYNEYKLADNMAPGGGWFEFGNYHLWGYGRLIEGMFGMESMKPANLDRVFAYHAADMDYLINLLSPYDPRFRARIVPGFGNSSNKYFEHLLEASGTFATRDPAMASKLMWAWEVNGMQPTNFPATIKPWVKPREPALKSRVFPGFGVVFRAHQGPDETYMLFRSGFLWSHWTVDQNHMVLTSKGAPLLTGHSFTYYDTPDKGFSQYNDIRFGHPSNEFHFSWPDSNILAHHFGERVQYAWSSSGYPAWFINPGRVPRYGPPPQLAPASPTSGQTEGDFTWDRQVIFLPGKAARSPNYFVIRDTVEGDGKLGQWFNLNALGRKSDVAVQGDRIALNTEWPTKLDAIFPGEGLRQPDLFEDDTLLDCPGGPYWPTFQKLNEGKPVSKNWKRKDGKPVDMTEQRPLNPDIENHVLIRMPFEPGSGHFWLLYPRGEGEAPPQATRPKPTVMKITHGEGTDYVVSASPYAVTTLDDIKVVGRSGVVRLRGDEVTLALLNGSGRVEYKGYGIEGIGPIERTLKLAALGPGVDTIVPDKKSQIEAPLPMVGATNISSGLTRSVNGSTTQYVLHSEKFEEYKAGDVTIKARRAVILKTDKSVRFVAPEAEYVKLTIGTVGVRGVGPFDLTFTDDAVTGQVKGDVRSIALTKPANIIRPMFHLDGVRWYAGYSDDTAPFRGRSDPQFSLAFGVTEGEHKVEIKEAVYPPLPPVPKRVAIKP